MAPDAEGSESPPQAPPPQQQQQQQQSPPPSAAGSPSSPVAQSFSPFQGGAPQQQKQRRPGIVFTEEINFCLPPAEEEGGSGSGSGSGGEASLLADMNPAVLRTVNSFANQAAKKILIAVDCCFQVGACVRGPWLLVVGGGHHVRGLTYFNIYQLISPSPQHVQDISEAVKARLRSDYGEGRSDVEAACAFIDAVRGWVCWFQVPAS